MWFKKKSSKSKEEKNQDPFLSQDEGDSAITPPPAAFLQPPPTPRDTEDPFATPPRTADTQQGESSSSWTSYSRPTSHRKTRVYGTLVNVPATESQPSLTGKDGDSTTDDDELAKASTETPKKTRRGYWRGFWTYLNNRINLKAIWELINPLEYFWPITFKKYFYLMIVAGCIAAIYFTDKYFNWIHHSMNLTREYMLPVLILVIGLEPLMFLIILAASTLPPKEETRETKKLEARMNGKEKLVDVEVQSVDPEEERYEAALVLPCHNSDRDALKRVFESAYPYFRPKDIFVVDNGRTRHPKDMSFRDWVKNEHPEIHYIWSPIGSKNAAQLVGALAAKDYRYILTTDDDVSLPPNYRHPIHLINEKVKGVAFPLAGIDGKGECPLFLVAWQDCEYRMSGLTKLAESNLCGVCFPHGAGWFVEREILVELLAQFHPTDFIAEDVNSGFCLMKMKKRIAFDFRVVLATEVPTTLLGPGLNWFKQRIKSWEMGRHKMLLTFLRRLFALNGQDTMTGFLAQKGIMLYNIATIFVDWIRVPIFVTMGYSSLFWMKATLMTLASVIPLLLYNYIKCFRRPEMRVRFVAALTYPIYKQLYAFVSVLGAIRCVMFYLGGYVKAKPIYKMIKDGDEECFWLDPRFEENPGWLVDEREEILREEEAQRLAEEREQEGVLRQEEEREKKEKKEREEEQLKNEQESQNGTELTEVPPAAKRSFWRRNKGNV